LHRGVHSWNWTFQHSTTGEHPGTRSWVDQGVLQPVGRSRPLNTSAATILVERVEVLPAIRIQEEARIPRWQWLALAALPLVVFSSVSAMKTWQRTRFLPRMSSPISIAASGVPALPPTVLESDIATSTLNDNPVPIQEIVSTQGRDDAQYTIDAKKPAVTNPSKEKVRLVTGKPQPINVVLVPAVASVAADEASETQVLADGPRTGVAATGSVDVPPQTEQDGQPGEKLSAPVKERVVSDSPGSETVATVSFEPMAPSRLHTILKTMSPARVVHPHEKVGFVPAKPIHQATASVPLRLMRGARGQISAHVRVNIDKRGKVSSVNREPAADKGPLPDAAIAAAWNWTFTPARKGSNPVESQAILHFRFQNPEFASRTGNSTQHE
jgi:hypothetical protein